MDGLWRPRSIQNPTHARYGAGQVGRLCRFVPRSAAWPLPTPCNPQPKQFALGHRSTPAARRSGRTGTSRYQDGGAVVAVPGGALLAALLELDGRGRIERPAVGHLRDRAVTAAEDVRAQGLESGGMKGGRRERAGRRVGVF